MICILNIKNNSMELNLSWGSNSRSSSQDTSTFHGTSVHNWPKFHQILGQLSIPCFCIYILMLWSHAWLSQVFSSHSAFIRKLCTCFSSPPCLLHAISRQFHTDAFIAITISCEMCELVIFSSLLLLPLPLVQILS